MDESPEPPSEEWSPVFQRKHRGEQPRCFEVVVEAGIGYGFPSFVDTDQIEVLKIVFSFFEDSGPHRDSPDLGDKICDQKGRAAVLQNAVEFDQNVAQKAA